MSREVRRISMDFDWPMNFVWKGYINPYRPKECKMCDGTGMNKETKKIDESWYGDPYVQHSGWCYNLDQDDVQALVDANRLWDFTRVPINDEQAEIIKKKIADGGNSWLPVNNGYTPTADEVNQWAKQGLGHDCSSKWICVKAKAKRLGVDGDCPLCNGAGYYWADDKYEALWDAFEWIEPPEGGGYQMWETTSEGSPISPVFAAPEELARWLAENNVSTFGRHTTTYEKWLSFIQGPGWAPSAISDGKTMKSGVEAVTE